MRRLSLSLALLVALAIASPLPPAGEDIDLWTLFTAGLLPSSSCAQPCLADLTATLRELLYFKDTIHNFDNLCRTYENASLCVEKAEASCGAQSSFSDHSGHIFHACRQKLEQFAPQQQCIEDNVDNVLNECNAECGFTSAAAELSQRDSVHAMATLGGNPFLLIEELDRVCPATSCFITCLSRQMDSACSPAGRDIADLILRPLFAHADLADQYPEWADSVFALVPPPCHPFLKRDDLSQMASGTFEYVETEEEEMVIIKEASGAEGSGSEGSGEGSGEGSAEMVIDEEMERASPWSHGSSQQWQWQVLNGQWVLVPIRRLPSHRPWHWSRDHRRSDWRRHRRNAVTKDEEASGDGSGPGEEYVIVKEEDIIAIDDSKADGKRGSSHGNDGWESCRWVLSHGRWIRDCRRPHGGWSTEESSGDGSGSGDAEGSGGDNDATIEIVDGFSASEEQRASHDDRRRPQKQCQWKKFRGQWVRDCKNGWNSNQGGWNSSQGGWNNNGGWNSNGGGHNSNGGWNNNHGGGWNGGRH